MTSARDPMIDVAIIGGGPAGLAAALALVRACKRVVLYDCWPPRNAAATEVHGFVTQDGTPPEEMRRAAREQLARYPAFTAQDDARVLAIAWRVRRVLHRDTSRRDAGATSLALHRPSRRASGSAGVPGPLGDGAVSVSALPCVGSPRPALWLSRSQRHLYRLGDHPARVDAGPDGLHE